MSIGIDKRVQVNRIVESQLPEFVRSDFPLAVDFLKQYYLSQEFQGGSTDLIDNLDQYLKVDNLVPEVVHGTTTLSSAVSTSPDFSARSCTSLAKLAISPAAPVTLPFIPL